MYYISWVSNWDIRIFGRGKPIFKTLDMANAFIEGQLILDYEKRLEGKKQYDITYRAISLHETRVLNAED